MAIVGSAPSCTLNPDGLIDLHDVVVRINNYKLIGGAGKRTDVLYSFFGNSIRKSPEQLKADGVTLCMCKCPDAAPIQSAWHERNGKQNGIDFRYIYDRRESWWFCDTYIQSEQDFLDTFELLGRHIPTTGFSAIREISGFNPKSIYLTGFDFFRSGMHNVTDTWRPGPKGDPIAHDPERELECLKTMTNIAMDQTLQELISQPSGTKASFTRITSGAATRRSSSSRRRRSSARVTVWT